MSDHATTEAFIGSNRHAIAWLRRHPVPEDHALLGATDNWLNALPSGVRPIHLQSEFPRILNEICRLWDSAAALDHYFEEKEFSVRNDRAGFSPLVKEELLALHVYSLRTRASLIKPLAEGLP